MKKYRIGISSTLDYSIEIEKQIALFAKYNLDFISIGGDPTHSKITDPARFPIVLDQIKRGGMFVESFHLPFADQYDLASSNKSARKEAVNLQLEYLDILDSYEIGIAILHPHHFFKNKENCLKSACESLEYLLSRVETNVTIAIENLPTSNSSWIFENIMRQFGPEKIGFCYDSSHENMSGAPFHLLSKYYARLTTTHLSDNHGLSDEHLAPGEGAIDWDKLADYIKKSPLENVLFEVGTGEPLGEFAELALKRTIAKAKELFDCE